MTLRRVALVPAAAIASEQVEGWFTAAWLDMFGPEPPGGAPQAAAWLRGESETRLVALVDDEPLGFVALRERTDSLELEAFAVAPVARNEGVGAEIIVQLEHRTTAARLRAYFPQVNGYAFYFWLRAGYRPVFAADHHRPGLNAVERLLH